MRTFFALVLSTFALQPATQEIRLIVKGDDMGAAHGINTATIAAFRQGVLTTTIGAIGPIRCGRQASFRKDRSAPADHSVRSRSFVPASRLRGRDRMS